jgi:hypothetical protein
MHCAVPSEAFASITSLLLTTDAVTFRPPAVIAAIAPKSEIAPQRGTYGLP